MMFFTFTYTQYAHCNFFFFYTLCFFFFNSQLLEYKPIFNALEVIKYYSIWETHFAQRGVILARPSLIGFLCEMHKLTIRTRELKDILLIILTRLQCLNYKEPKLQSLVHARRIYMMNLQAWSDNLRILGTREIWYLWFW